MEQKCYSVERYIIHKHTQPHRKGLEEHLDLRFSVPKIKQIFSFAIPKPEKLPKKIGDKQLVIQGPNHSRVFLNIKDITIPEGEFGHGRITMIEEGSFCLQGFSEDYLTFTIIDPKPDALLNGRYLLTRLKNRNLKSDKYKKDNMFIFMKIKLKQ